MRSLYDIAIIGSGPAGLSAAVELSKSGLTIALFDEQTSPGGQIYRSAERFSFAEKPYLGKEFEYGTLLIKEFKKSPIDYFPCSSIWQISRELEIGVSLKKQSYLIKARQVILATGAIERPFPVPGWTLPGVSTIGSAQILLKSHGLAEDHSILIGSGPLLYLLAVQYLRAGVKIKAILDTNNSKNKFRALAFLPRALGRLDLVYQGVKWISEIKNAKLQYVNKVSKLELIGKKHLTSVAYETEAGATGEIKAKRAFLHQGVTPNINLSMATRCDHIWDPIQLCWKPWVNVNGETTIPNLFIIGDGAGIIGAKASEASGHLLGIQIRSSLKSTQDLRNSKNYKSWQSILSKELQFRPFIDTLFKPRKNFRIPDSGHTIVCRCEEVTAKQVQENIRLGCLGPNQMKAFCRAGMGPCQGRLCGITISEIIASERNVSVSDVGYYRLRPPIKPLTLLELANLNNTINPQSAKDY